MADTAPGPLAGVTVLDCGIAGVGPWAASLLGFLGARVIKVERPGGDFIKAIYPRTAGVGAAYPAFNVDQQVLELDLKAPDDLRRFDDLVKEADIFIENFRRGVAERLCMGEARLRAINPRIVYGSSSAWGDGGPMRDLGAVDSHLQAFSGFASLNGAPGAEPEMLRYVHIDPNGSVHFAALLVLGLIQRRRSGAGSFLRTSHFAMSLAMQASRIAEHFETGEPLLPLGSAAAASAPNACWKAADGVWLAVSAETQESWLGLCAALDRRDWALDQRFVDNAARLAHRDELSELLASHFAIFPARWWIARLEQCRVPHSRLLDFDDLRYHSQIVANGYLQEVACEQGPVVLGGVPWQFSRTPARGCTRGGIAPAQRGCDDDSVSATESPLSNCRVLDLSEGIAGPFAGLLLAEAGAVVTKLESPEGDWSRQLGSGDYRSSAVFESFNRNKTGLCRDPRKAADRAEVGALLNEVDLLIYDRGSDWSLALGLADDGLEVRYPALLVVEVSHWGTRGPLAGQPGSELAVQAMTGYLRNLGEPGGTPVRVGADIAGCGTAAMILLGALAAWFERQTSGLGQRVSCSALGTLMAMRSMRWASVDKPDAWQGPDCDATTSRPLRPYHTRDGQIWPSLRTIRDPAVLGNILDFLDLPPELQANAGFMHHIRDTLGLGFLSGEWRDQWNRLLCRHSRAELLKRFRQANGIAVEFMQLHETLAHPQTRCLDVIDCTDRGGRYLRAPWTVSWQRPALQPAPRIPAVPRLEVKTSDIEVI